MNKKFINVEIIKNLTKNSYEDKLYKIYSFIYENKDNIVKDNNIKVQPIATFDDSVIVCCSDGTFLKVILKENKDIIVIESVEKLDVPLFSSQDILDSYLDKLLESKFKNVFDKF